ncbi:polycystin-1-like protein 3 [Onthophagus taurus]|uniref:polycystin-1-like protein 3 n=1 Tax=Onthophagus taurus TaxID=166361 RepID=UPI0039BDF886
MSILNVKSKLISSTNQNTSYNNKTINNLQFKLDDTNNLDINLLLYIPVLVTLCLYCLLWILSHKNLFPQCIYFLSDNHKDDRFAYLLEIKTGMESGSGTTSNVTIKIFGSTGISRAHVVNYPDPDLRLLRYNGEDYFIVTTEKHLGELIFIQLWIDFISIEPKWNCDQIRICDLQTKHWWLFIVNNWLTIDKKNHYCLKVWATPSSLKKKIRCRLLLPSFNAQHTWNFWHSR